MGSPKYADGSFNQGEVAVKIYRAHQVWKMLSRCVNETAHARGGKIGVCIHRRAMRH